MHYHNDFEAWRQHHNELLQEASERRLARQLRAAQSGENSPDIWRALRGFVPGLHPQSGKMADC
jgi:hypothetical protein